MALSKIDTTNMIEDVPQSKLDNNIGFRNIIINGDMSIAQRGTSSSSSGVHTVDRFRAEFSGVSVTQSQQSLTSGDPYDDGLRYFFRSANTSTSSATSAFLQIYQQIEAQNLNSTGWKFTSSSSFVTYSFWVRSSLAGTYYINLRSNDGTSQNFSSPIVLVADTWKKVSFKIPGNSNITINNDNGAGLFVGVVPHYGTDYTTSGHTTDAWSAYSGTNITPDYSQSWTNTASATFDITAVQLEVGETASDFEFLPTDVNLERCMRYYQTYFMSLMILARYNASTGLSLAQFFFSKTMRAEPTFSTSGTFISSAGYTGTPSGSTLKTTSVNLSGPSIAANQVEYCGGSDAFINLDAEL